MKHVGIIAISVLLANGCMSRASMRVLQPAELTMPADIKTLALVDRTRAKNFGQSVLGALEGLVSGEGIGVDRNGAEETMDALLVKITASPRFDAVIPYATPKELESSVFATQMTWETANKICDDTNADGIVSLEAFDSDSYVEVESSTSEDNEGNTTTSWTATRDTTILTAWRVYWPAQRRFLDDLRDHRSTHSWDYSGESESEARNGLPSLRRTIEHLGKRAGKEYGNRIAPGWVTVYRSYYGGGSDEMKLARSHVRVGQWDDARTIWHTVIDTTTDPALKGKATLNLAVSAEVAGKLRRAHELAMQARTLLPNGVTQSYIHILDRRISDDQKMREQMAPVGGP